MLKLARGLFKQRSRKVVFFTSLVAIIVLMSGGFVFARLGGFGDTGSNINLNAGLVGWWKLDGNAKDSTPYQNNGTLSGTTTVSDRFGNPGGALSFNGTTDQISISNFTHNVMLPSAFNSSWTLSIWATSLLGSNANERILLGKQGCNGGIYTWNNQYQFALKASACWTGAQSITATGITDTSKWHLLTATYSAGNMAFYADGVLQGTATLASMTGNYNTTTIGIGSTGNNSYNFSGQLDDARIYNRALSAAEAKALFDQGSTGINVGSGQKGLVGWWKFNGNAKDSTPYGANPTSVVGATLTTDRKGRANSAYSFTGTSGQGIFLPNGKYSNFGTNSFTVMAWIKTVESGGQRCIMSTAGSSQGWRFGYSGGWPYYLVGDGTHYQEGVIGSTGLNDGKWHHLAIVYNYASNWSVTSYIDGALTGTVSLPATIGSVNNNFGAIGTMSSGLSGVVTGSVSDVRTYSRALSASDIANIAGSYNSQIALGGSGDAGSVSLGKGLVGYWPFNGNAKDATPFGNNGVLTNSPTQVADRKNRANSAYSFSGSNYISTNSSGYVLPTSINASLSFWVNLPVQSSSFNRLFSSSGTSNTEIYFTSNGTNGLYGNFGSGPSGWICKNPDLTGGWKHIVLISSGTTGYLDCYVNGVLISHTNTSVTQVTIQNLGIGVNNAKNAYYLTGSLDDVRIYNRALNANEVMALYNSYN